MLYFIWKVTSNNVDTLQEKYFDVIVSNNKFSKHRAFFSYKYYNWIGRKVCSWTHRNFNYALRIAWEPRFVGNINFCYTRQSTQLWTFKSSKNIPVVKPSSLKTFEWNRPRDSWVMIGHTNILTEITTFFNIV